MRHVSTYSKQAAFVILSFLFGVGFIAGLFFIVKGQMPDPFLPLVRLFDRGAFSQTIARSGDNSIVVDLETKEILIFEKGVRTTALPILSLPPKGSTWELSRGTFEIETREELHRSALAKGTFPYAVSFGGNMFAHGPRSADEKNRGVGGVELSLPDAKKLFSYGTVGMPVRIIGDGKLAASSLGGALLSPKKAFAETLPAVLPKDELLADAYLIGDLDTGAIIMSEHATAIRPMASVSKLFTGLVAEDVLASSTPQDSRTFGLSYKELLYPLFLQSSNVAADELARLGGGKKFMEAVNKKAKDLGLTHTALADPSGLSPKNVSTAEDLFVLAQELYKHHPDILALSKLPKYGGYQNNNFFVRTADPRYIGGKIGYTPEAGQTWVAFFELPLSEFKSKHLALILLRSPNRLRDAKSALSRIEDALYGKEGEGALLAGSIVHPEVARAKETTLLFVGDIMLDRGVKASVQKNCAGDYTCLFRDAGFLKAADITFGNLEGPASDKGYDLKNLYSFRMDPAVLPVLRSAGFDALSVANNHAGDWGRPAFEDTLARLREAGISAVGGGLSGSEAREVQIIEKNGLRFGFLGFSDVGPKWLTEPEDISTILPASHPRYKEIIKTAKSKTDVLIVSFHWGEEYKDLPTDRQRMLAHAAVDAGADIVVGHHPHTREPIERYGNAIIDYSLGNFIFDQDFSDKTTEGGVLAITLSGTTTVDVSEHISRQNEYFVPSLTEDYEF